MNPFQVFFQQGRQQNLKSPRMGKLFFIIFQRGVPTKLLTFHRLPAAKINKNQNSNKIINFEREIYSFSLSLSCRNFFMSREAERVRKFSCFNFEPRQGEIQINRLPSCSVGAMNGERGNFVENFAEKLDLRFQLTT